MAISPPLGPLPPPDDRSAPVDVHYLQGNMSAMRRNLSSVSTTNLSMTTALSKQKSTILLQQEQINALARDMLLLKAEREQTGREDGRGGNGESVGGGARGGGGEEAQDVAGTTASLAAEPAAASTEPTPSPPRPRPLRVQLAFSAAQAAVRPVSWRERKGREKTTTQI